MHRIALHRQLDWRLATEGNRFFFSFFFFLPEKRMLKRPAVGASSRIAMINKRFREEEETTAPSPPPSTPRSIDKFAHSKRDELQNTHTHTHTNETEEKSHGEREAARSLMKYRSMATNADCQSQEFRHNRKRACLLACRRAQETKPDTRMRSECCNNSKTGGYHQHL